MNLFIQDKDNFYNTFLPVKYKDILFFKLN